MKRSLSGITATGTLHIGNYLGMIKPALNYQENYQCLYFIADLHGLISCKDPEALRLNIYDQVAAWLALGMDTEKHIMYRQSDIPMVTEFTWYLSCNTGFGFLEKSHAFKDAQANKKDINVGLFTYPVLMASDIIMYDADIVPVGKDQKQHVEMARDIAGSFNATYSAEVLKLPEVVIKEEVMTIPGLDGRKMSKSYNNYIPLFGTEKEVRKKVMSLETDSTALEEPKSMQKTILGQLLKHFVTEDQYADLEQRLNKGGTGWGHAKEELFEAINNEIKDARVVYNDLRSDETKLDRVLKDGQEKAYEIARPVLDRVRKAVGIDNTPRQ